MSSWADMFNTYEEACIYYGVDTPAQVEAEERCWEQEAAIEEQDRLEARGPTVGRFAAADLEIPF
jgi:hypothetical protein